MIRDNKKEGLIKNYFKNRYSLIELLHNFNFNLDPSDADIKEIKISSVRLKSYNGYCDLTVQISGDEESVFDVVKINNLEIQEIELRVTFFDDRSIFVKIKSSDNNQVKINPIIDKYLQYWGLPVVAVN